MLSFSHWAASIEARNGEIVLSASWPEGPNLSVRAAAALIWEKISFTRSRSDFRSGSLRSRLIHFSRAFTSSLTRILRRSRSPLGILGILQIVSQSSSSILFGLGKSSLRNRFAIAVPVSPLQEQVLHLRYEGLIRVWPRRSAAWAFFSIE